MKLTKKLLREALLAENSVKNDERVNIYRDNYYIVVRPLNERASCKYGAHTKWCISAPSSGAWDDYNDNLVIIMIIQRNYKIDSERQEAISKMLEYNDAADNNEVTPEMHNEIKRLKQEHDFHYFEDLSKIALVFDKSNGHSEIWDNNNISLGDYYKGWETLPISANVINAIKNYLTTS